MEKRFVFRGNAVGVAAHIHKPDDLIIWVQGASSLPVIGGYSRSNVDRAAFGDVLSFDNARTQATGDFSVRENAYKTLADSVVKALNVNGRLTATRSRQRSLQHIPWMAVSLPLSRPERKSQISGSTDIRSTSNWTSNCSPNTLREIL